MEDGTNGCRLQGQVSLRNFKTRCATSQYSEVSKSLEREGGNSGCHSGTPDAITLYSGLFWDSCASVTLVTMLFQDCYSVTLGLLLLLLLYNKWDNQQSWPKSITFNHSELVTILPIPQPLSIRFCQTIISFRNSLAGKNKISEFILHSDSTHLSLSLVGLYYVTVRAIV